MKFSKTAMTFAALTATFLIATPANAEEQPSDGDVLVAPADDGTNGAYDVDPEIVIVAPDSETDGAGPRIVTRATTACSPNSTWYKVTSATKSGKVTNWDRHYKNDSTFERFNWTTQNSTTVKATASVSGTASASAGIKKIAEASLSMTTGYALEGQKASTSTYSHTVEFKTPGTWVIYAGVYTGSGTVSQYKCSSNGRSSSRIGSVSVFTFNKARTTGTINCKNSVNDVVGRNAKALCG